jgi:hypothetical protein
MWDTNFVDKYWYVKYYAKYLLWRNYRYLEKADADSDPKYTFVQLKSGNAILWKRKNAELAPNEHFSKWVFFEYQHDHSFK